MTNMASCLEDNWQINYVPITSAMIGQQNPLETQIQEYSENIIQYFLDDEFFKIWIATFELTRKEAKMHKENPQIFERLDSLFDFLERVKDDQKYSLAPCAANLLLFFIGKLSNKLKGSLDEETKKRAVDNALRIKLHTVTLGKNIPDNFLTAEQMIDEINKSSRNAATTNIEGTYLNVSWSLHVL